MRKKRIINNTKNLSILLLFIISFILIGCEEPLGLRIGFNFDREERNLLVAVSSEEREFYVDDVWLDFHFGWNGTRMTRLEDGRAAFEASDEEVIIIGVGLYIVNQRNINHTINGDDYRVRPYATFLRMIYIEEFRSTDFEARNVRRREKSFNHVESFKIPSEQLINQGSRVGVVVFMIIMVIHCSERGMYSLSDFTRIGLGYEFIDENTVRF